jgi:hypothetical protein
MNDILTQGIKAPFKSGSLDLDQICQAWVVTIQSRTTSIYSAFNQRHRLTEGQNLVTEYLNPEKQAEGVPGAIRELLCRKVDNIVAPYQSTVKAASIVVLICINDDLSARFNRKT